MYIASVTLLSMRHCVLTTVVTTSQICLCSTKMDTSGLSGPLRFRVKVILDCDTYMFERAEMRINMPPQGTCPRTRGEAELSVDKYYNLKMYGSVKAEWDVNWCLISTLSYTLYQAIEW